MHKPKSVFQNPEKAAFLICVSSAIFFSGCSFNKTESEVDNSQATANEAKQNVTSTHFRDAVNKATTAAELAQTAQTSEEWSNVAKTWQESIDLMASVPQSDSNHEIAQQKFQDYQKNQEYAQSNAKNEQMYEEMLEAISIDSPEKIKSLIDQGFNPNYQTQSRTQFDRPYHVLAHAASFSNDSTVRLLLSSGAKWEGIPKQALSDSLLSASCEGQSFVVQELLKAGADPNYVNKFGEKPLAMANSEVCRKIDNNGKSREANSSNHDKVVQILKTAGAK